MMTKVRMTYGELKELIREDYAQRQAQAKEHSGMALDIMSKVLNILPNGSLVGVDDRGQKHRLEKDVRGIRPRGWWDLIKKYGAEQIVVRGSLPGLPRPGQYDPESFVRAFY